MLANVSLKGENVYRCLVTLLTYLSHWLLWPHSESTDAIIQIVTPKLNMLEITGAALISLGAVQEV